VYVRGWLQPQTRVKRGYPVHCGVQSTGWHTMSPPCSNAALVCLAACCHEVDPKTVLLCAQVDVADTVGCGDSFAAAVVMGYTRNHSIPATLALANAVGGATAMGKGAGATSALFAQWLGHCILLLPPLLDFRGAMSRTERKHGIEA